MRSVVLHLVGLGGLAVVTAGGRLVAQALPSRDSALTAVVDSASRIRVRLPAGWATLEQPRWRQDTLQFLRGTTLDRGGRVVPVRPPLALTNIAEIQVPAGHKGGKAAAWGAGIGAALGLLIAVGAAAESDDCLGCPTESEALAALPIMSAVGAGLGFLIGSASTKWVSVYRSP